MSTSAPHNPKQPKWGGHGYKVESASVMRKRYERRVIEMQAKHPGASPGEIDAMIFKERQ